MKSVELFHRAERTIPGGVNSPVRAFRGVGGTPIFFERGEGAHVVDVDGKRYIDFVGSWGPLILGHCHPEVQAALEDVLRRGTSFGAPTELEVELAELIVEIVPGLEMVRLVSSGTEATMSALRLARAITGRPQILKFDGCYHGHSDSLLVAAGSGVATLGIAGSPGVPKEIAELTTSVEFNDLQVIEDALSRLGAERFAAIIVEPVPGNMGLVMPRAGFLEGLRKICDRSGILLVFDEVMTGFRVGLGGAAERFRVEPDLWTFGKVIGGGLPVGAFGGKRKFMSQIAPSGPVYQAGTLSGNPLAVTAGLTALRILRGTNPYPKLEETSRTFVAGFVESARKHDVLCVGAHCGGMAGFFFSRETVTNFSEAKKSDVEFFKRFYRSALQEGVYLAPSAFEANFISTAHTPDVLRDALARIERAFRIARS